MKIFTLLLTVFVSLPGFASTEISGQLKREFAHVYTRVSKLKPEGEVGGYLNSKVIGDYEVLWNLADEPGEYDVIRIYRDKGGYDAFALSYYRSDSIVQGRTVIRRFIGPVISGWRNDTMDVNTGEYLGRQGAPRPVMDERDVEILKEWKAELFE